MTTQQKCGETEPKRSTTIKYINPQVPKVELPSYSGQPYEVTVPDTLDLQDMAALAINGMTGPTNPEADYTVYWRACFNIASRPVMWIADSSDVGILAMFLEAVPLLRTVSGTDLNRHVEKRWLETVRQMQGPDGLLYLSKIGRPWHIWNYTDFAAECMGKEPPGDYYRSPFFDGRALGALTAYCVLTGSSEWKSVCEKLAAGLAEQIVIEGPKAHLPIAADPELLSGRRGMASVAILEHMFWIQGLTQFAKHLGHEPSLELAGKLVRWVMEDSDYYDSTGRFLQDYPDKPAAHFYHHVGILSAIVDYVIASGDTKPIDFVLRSFNYAMANGECILGYFPEWVGASYNVPSEICEVAEMIGLALKLSRHGFGDYYDQAERWVRNLFVEAQVKPIHYERLHWKTAGVPDTMYAPMKLPPYHTDDRVVERNTGAFMSTLGVNDLLPGTSLYMGSSLDGIAHCCTGNAARAIYYAWEHIVTHDAGKLRVNLLLNRASQWADVDSYLPYTGRVDVRVKEAVDLSIRLPEWVKPEQATCTMNENDRKLSFQGRYAVVGKVTPGDAIALCFPIEEKTDQITVEKRAYRIVMRGNTCVAIDPPGQNVPLFRRDHYRTDETRWRKITRFLANKVIEW